MAPEASSQVALDLCTRPGRVSDERTREANIRVISLVIVKEVKKTVEKLVTAAELAANASRPSFGTSKAVQLSGMWFYVFRNFMQSDSGAREQRASAPCGAS